MDDLQGIRERLAEVIFEGLGGRVNTHWCEDQIGLPACTVRPHPNQFLMYWGTCGPDGKADGMLQLVLEAAGQDVSSVASQLMSMLGVGSNADLSVVDVVVRNRTLGGLVDEAMPMNVSFIDEPAGRAIVDVKVIYHKQDAEA